jgi:hypothetical protein
VSAVDGYVVLSEAYLAGAKPDDARRALALARAATGTKNPIAQRATFAMTDARLRAADAPAEAVAALRAVVDETTRSGHLRLALEARLYLGQAEFQANQPHAARTHLERLKKEASAKGFRLIVRKATTALDAAGAARPSR